MVTSLPVRAIFVFTEVKTTMSLRTPLTVADPTDEEVSELGTSVGASTVTPPKMDLEVIKTVWEFDRIEKRGGPDSASKTWYCGWCNSSFKGGWNATKALLHCARVAGSDTDIRPCSGPIPKDVLAIFQGFRFRKMGKKNAKRMNDDAYKNTVAENQMSISVAFETGRSRQSASFIAGDVMSVGDGDGDVAVTNSTKLTTAIAEFVYCKGLPFSAVEGEEFQRILKIARLVPNSYRPPARKLLANDLLEHSYQSRLSKYLVNLEVDSEVYGISLFGDGVTVHGMPLMNILASGVMESCAVLSIVDCKFIVLLCICFIFNCTLSSLIVLACFFF
jgi:hypothetical protein